MAAAPFDALNSPSLLAEKVKWLEKKNADLETTMKENDDVIERLSAQCSALEKLQRSQKDDTNIQKFIEFPYSELEEATHDFRPSFRLGEGTFGVVYKGKLRYTYVAVKKLIVENTEKVSEFEREVTVLSRVQHPNLVTLIGACLEPHCLVYEYLPNGSLEDRLLCTNGTQPLTWDVRCRIAAEICWGLLFLHSANPHTIVHVTLNLRISF